MISDLITSIIFPTARDFLSILVGQRRILYVAPRIERNKPVNRRQRGNRTGLDSHAVLISELSPTGRHYNAIPILHEIPRLQICPRRS